ncbi:MAG: tRNA (adenosine(37)-N6)-threonylcarbamoyltransferase complex ATPase subunit type 1 TsaE [Candidatus Latescibacterota bacterium]|nr:MAG: tRNA (adenosine(37)-N6)-threonylcarbamoyltransferase complex ATPase subunit type 1 TsaE [Candidatus Latescibacterota bacterium]
MTRTETKVVTTSSEIETERFGMFLGHRITGDLCVSLVGSLGSGKSVLVRGVCKGLGIDEEVLSPTFILCEEYRGRIPVIHLDLYRLDHEREIEELGVFDRIGDGSLMLVEWGDRSAQILDASDIVLNIEMTGTNERRIGIGYTAACAEIIDDTVGEF